MMHDATRIPCSLALISHPHRARRWSCVDHRGGREEGDKRGRSLPRRHLMLRCVLCRARIRRWIGHHHDASGGLSAALGVLACAAACRRPRRAVTYPLSQRCFRRLAKPTLPLERPYRSRQVSRTLDRFSHLSYQARRGCPPTRGGGAGGEITRSASVSCRQVYLCGCLTNVVFVKSMSTLRRARRASACVARDSLSVFFRFLLLRCIHLEYLAHPGRTHRAARILACFAVSLRPGALPHRRLRGARAMRQGARTLETANLVPAIQKDAVARTRIADAARS